MSTLEKIEAVIDKIPCPVCLNSRLGANLSCDSPNSLCDVHALCDHCGHRFVVTNDTRTMEELWPKIQQEIKKKKCPECGDDQFSMEFLCDVKSEDCYFLVRCTKSSHYSRVSRDSIQYLFG
jgi:hypothetical protein